MLVGALLDLGADQEKLLAVLQSLPVEGYTIQISRVKKAGIDACDFDVVLDEAHANHDHDMDYLHGHDHAALRQDNPQRHGHGGHHEEFHTHDHDGEHSHHHGEHHHDEAHHHEDVHHTHEYRHDEGQHSHDNHGGHHHHHHEHRHLADVFAIIDAGEMTERARSLAKRIFTIVAEAESRAHALPVEEVHFHEVGAVDSIVDIVAIAVCVDDLGIREWIVPYLSEGHGTVRCQHGILPIPVPAVQNISQMYGLPLQRIAAQGEFVTPTGAAAVAALRSEQALPSVYQVKRSGIGAGKRQYERASLVRLMEIETADIQGQAQVSGNGGQYISSWDSDVVWRLETDIDDTTGERLGYVLNALIDAGAREAHYTPVFMKKNRPAVELTVICDDAHRDKLEDFIFKETTTIGIRRARMERHILPRLEEKWETPRGMLAVKRITLPDGRERIDPEHDSLVALAKKEGETLSELWEWAVSYIAKNRGQHE